MAQVIVSVTLAASAERVWDCIGGFQSLAEWSSSIKTSMSEHGGRVRRLKTTDGAIIAERFDDRQDVEIHIYPGAEHGFNCTHRDSYQQRAAAHAHGNSLIFLAENL